MKLHLPKFSETGVFFSRVCGMNQLHLRLLLGHICCFFKVPASKGIFWELRPCGSPFGGFCLQVLQPFFAFLVQNLDDMMTMTMTTTTMMMMTTMIINGYEVVRRLCMRPQDFETEDICNYIVWIQHFGIILNPTSTPQKNFVRCSPSFFFNPEFPKNKNQIRMICFFLSSQ